MGSYFRLLHASFGHQPAADQCEQGDALALKLRLQRSYLFHDGRQYEEAREQCNLI